MKKCYICHRHRMSKRRLRRALRGVHTPRRNSLSKRFKRLRRKLRRRMFSLYRKIKKI